MFCFVFREQILNMPNEDKKKVIEVLSCLPCGLETEDVPDFCSLAQYYSNKTPSSFRDVSFVLYQIVILYTY